MKLEEKALFGLPVETEYGNFKPMSVYDYMDCAHLLQALSFDKKRVLHEIRLSQPEDMQKKKETTTALQKLNEEYSLKEVIVKIIPAYFLAYVDILLRCREFDFEYDEDKEGNEEQQRTELAHKYLIDLSNEDFDAVRKILLAINAQSEQTAFLNPELQDRKERTLKFKSSQSPSDAPDASTLVTTVVTYTGINYDQVVKWNITQLQHAFQRVALFLSYDTYITFATVAGDKIDAVNWAENIITENDSNSSSSFAVELEEFAGHINQQLS